VQLVRMQILSPLGPEKKSLIDLVGSAHAR
jgi:hypothetical protein